MRSSVNTRAVLNKKRTLISGMTRGERKILLGSIVIAIFTGGLAACIAYSDRRDDQFHGVLDSDKYIALWHAVLDGAIAFVEFSIPALLIAGVLPILMRRSFVRWKTEAAKSDD